MEVRKVMLVDDDADIRRIAELSLERIGGMEVVAVSSGEEAIARLPAAAPDVILLDVSMPDLDGPATLARFRELPNHGLTPVVFMTARLGPKDLETYRALGAAGVIPKPFDPVTLPQAVRDIAAGL